MEEKIIEKDMTPVMVEDLGKIYATSLSTTKVHYGMFKCQYCGTIFKSQVRHITSGATKSCKCYTKQKSKEMHTTHGLAYHPLYTIWRDMKRRCYNEKRDDYIHYGGRGIEVCEEWKKDLSNFYTWSLENGYVEGLSIDRIDVNGNYEPNNCRWTTQAIQCQNNRDIKSNNKSGFRGVSLHTGTGKWQCNIGVNNQQIYLGLYHSVLEAGKAYERYVRINNLEHNFTPALTEEEVEELNKQKEGL